MPILTPANHQLPDRGPTAVMGMVADLLEAALAANVHLIRPEDVTTVGPGRFGVSRIPVEESTLETDPAPTIAPEAPRSGPTPYTLVFSAAAIGALVALGDLAPAPHDPDEHAAWLRNIGARLRDRWRDEMRGRVEPPQIDAAHAIEWIERCLVYEPFQRPKPRRVLEAVHRRPQPVVPAHSTASDTADPTIGFPSLERPPRSETSLSVAIAAILAVGTAACTLGAVLARLWTTPEVPAPYPPPIQIVAPEAPPSRATPPQPEVHTAPPVPAPPAPVKIESPARQPEPPPRPAADPEPAAPAPEPAEQPPRTRPRTDLRPPWGGQ